MNAAKNFSALVGIVALVIATVTPSAAAGTGAWVLKSTEPLKEVPDSEGDCYNSQEVTVGELSATTYARCTWPSPAVDVWSRSQHSWSAAPPARLVAGEQWQITSTTSVEGTYLSAALTGGGSSWVRIDLVPGGGPYPGAGWASATEENTPASAVSEFTIPTGGEGGLMLVALSFQGPGGAGRTTYTYEWEGTAPDATGAPTVTGTVAPTQGEAPPQPAFAPCDNPGADSGARFSWISKEVEVFPESDPSAIFSAKPSTALRVYDHVITGEESSTMITFADLSTLVMKAESEVVIWCPELQSPRIEYTKGTFWTSIKKAILGDAIEAKTRLATLGIRGTTFVTEVTPDSTTLKVIEGEIEFSSIVTGEQTRVAAGESATAAMGGLSDTSTFDIETESARWDLDGPGGNGTSPTLVLGGVVAVAAVVLVLAGAGFVLVRRKRTSARP